MYILYCTNTIMLTVHNVSAIQSLVLSMACRLFMIPYIDMSGEWVRGRVCTCVCVSRIKREQLHAEVERGRR